MSNQYPGAPRRREPEDDALTPTLSTLDTRLRQDGIQWRDTDSDPAQWFPNLGHRSVVGVAGDDAHPARTTTLSERRLTLDGPATPTARLHAPAHRSSRLGTIAAGGSALIVVALLALLLHGLVGNRATSTAHKTSTAAPKTLQPATAWTTTSLGSPMGMPVVAPSNPSIIYEMNSSLSFQRTEDGGHTWQTLKAPTKDVAGDLGDSGIQGMAVSPADPNTLFLTVSSSASNPKCPASVLQGKVGGNISASGGYRCTFQYVSHDGGVTWAKPSVPDAGRLMEQVSNASPAIRAFGSRLYMLVDHDINGQVTAAESNYRLVQSSDGGNTWSYADQNLVSQGRYVQWYLGDVNGPGAWAMTLKSGFETNDNVPQLWRTDDGVTWHPAAQPTDCQSSAFCEVTGAAILGGNTSLFYLADLHAITNPQGMAVPMILDFNTRYEITTNGGQTWQALPTTGIPGGLKPVWNAQTVTLADGTLVVPFAHVTTQVKSQNGEGEAIRTTTDAAYFAWHPGGQSWQRLTPSLPAKSSPMNSWLLPRSGGGYTLWSLNTITTSDPTVDEWSLTSATLGLG